MGVFYKYTLFRGCGSSVAASILIRKSVLLCAPGHVPSQKSEILATCDSLNY